MAWDWKALLDRQDIVIVDTETTGFRKSDEVIDLAALDTRGHVRENTLIRPTGEIPTHASRVHGITAEDLDAVGAPRYPDVHERLAALLSSARVVLAWNAPFDRRLLRQTAGRYGLELPRATWQDLLQDYRWLRPGGQHGLAHALEREGIAGVQAHRALHDCHAVLNVMRALVQRTGRVR